MTETNHSLLARAMAGTHEVKHKLKYRRLKVQTGKKTNNKYLRCEGYTRRGDDFLQCQNKAVTMIRLKQCNGLFRYCKKCLDELIRKGIKIQRAIPIGAYET